MKGIKQPRYCQLLLPCARAVFRSLLSLINDCAQSLGTVDQGSRNALPPHLPTEQKDPYAHLIDVETKAHRCTGYFVLFCFYRDVNSTGLLYVYQNSNI